MDGVVDPTDLINLDDFSCYARLTVEGRRMPVFSLTLDPLEVLEEVQHAQAEVLRQRSQRRLGREVSAVDTLIAHAAVRRRAVAEQQTQYQQEGSRMRQEAHDQLQDSLPDIERGTMAMKTSNSAHESTTGERPGTFSGQAPQAAAHSGEKHGRTRSHWKRGKEGRRRPSEPPFTSLLLSRSEAGNLGEASDAEAEGSQGEEESGGDDREELP